MDLYGLLRKTKKLYIIKMQVKKKNKLIVLTILRKAQKFGVENIEELHLVPFSGKMTHPSPSSIHH